MDKMNHFNTLFLKSLTHLLLVILLLLLLLPLQGCMNSERSDLPRSLRDRDPLTILTGDKETFRVSMQRDIAFKDSLLLDRVKSVAIDESGAVLIAGEAWEKREIYRFDAAGNRLDTFGGYGLNEGEFLQIDNMQLSDGKLHVYDGLSERITVLNSGSGELIRSVDVRAVQYRDSLQALVRKVTPVHRFENESYLIGFRDTRNPAFYPDRKLVYAVVSNSGELQADSILIQPDMQYLVGDYAGRPAAFTLDRPERPLIVVDIWDRLISANTSGFVVEMHNPNNGIVNTIYSRYERAPLDKAEVINGRFSHNEQLLRVRQTAEYPEKWPALYSMVSDDGGNIWLSTITANQNEFKWWVIRPDGRYATFLWPANRRIIQVERGDAYVVEKDENGFEDVVRYRVLEADSAE